MPGDKFRVTTEIFILDEIAIELELVHYTEIA